MSRVYEHAPKEQTSNLSLTVQWNLEKNAQSAIGPSGLIEPFQANSDLDGPTKNNVFLKMNQLSLQPR